MRRGTCSTEAALLCLVLKSCGPQIGPRFQHRAASPYICRRCACLRKADVAAAVLGFACSLIVALLRRAKGQMLLPSPWLTRAGVR